MAPAGVATAIDHRLRLSVCKFGRYPLARGGEQGAGMSSVVQLSMIIIDFSHCFECGGGAAPSVDIAIDNFMVKLKEKTDLDEKNVTSATLLCNFVCGWCGELHTKFDDGVENHSNF